MATPNSDRASAWKALNPQQRDEAMSRMSPEQKSTLASDLGYKGDTTDNSSPPPPNSVMGGIGRRTVDTLKGLGQTFSMAPHPGENSFTASPDVRMLKGMYQSGKEAGNQAVDQFKAARAIPPGNKLIKSLEYARALNTGLSALDPFAAGTVANANKLQDEGRTREAVGQAIPDTLMLGLGTPWGSRAVEATTGGVVRGAKALHRGTLDAMAGTGPRVVKGLIKDTTAENVAGAEKVANENRLTSLKNEATRKAELRKHATETAKHEADKAASNAKLQKDLAAQREIEPTEKRIADAKSARQAAVETAREKARTVGNEKYGVVHTLMDDRPARDGFYKDVTEHAERGTSGSKGAPTILKAMTRRMESGKPVVYQDLQSDYSTLGNELSKGTLPGDVFTTYSDMHDAIGEEMQRMADSEGTPVDLTKVPRRMVDGVATDEPAYKTDIGKHVYDTRNYWRRMKQTFGKTKIINDAATKAIGGARDEAQENQMRLLGSFDPSIPHLDSLVQTLEAKAKSLPKPVPERVLTRNVAEQRTEAPNRVGFKVKLTPPEPTKLHIPKTIGPEDVQRAKAASLAEEGKGNSMANSLTVFSAARDILRRNPTGFAVDLGARGLVGAGRAVIRQFLDRPAVTEWLTKATQRDVDAIPPDLRGDFPNVVKAAQAKGIKVSPALIGIAAASPKKRVAAALSPQ